MDSFNQIVSILEKDNLFLTGGAGVGKSFAIRQISKFYAAEKKSVVVLGSTGISAINVGGQTLHSFFVFGISSNFDELQRSDRYNKSKIAELNKILKKLDLLIIDEISMVSADLMDMILYRLRNGGFRGKLMVVGDFYQLPPVSRNTPQNALFQMQYCFESSAWDSFDFVTLELTKIKRTSDSHFMKILGKLRVGILDEEVLEFLSLLEKNSIDRTKSTILYGTNREAESLNLARVNEHKGESIELNAIIKKIDNSLNDKMILGWVSKLPISQNLILKEGVPVIFTTNRWGFYHNGEKGVVEHIDDDVILVQKNDRLIKVERFGFDLSKTVTNKKGEIVDEIVCSLEQFPLRLGYAITIHKSQGMSIDNLLCNIDSIFADSQFYVALSRATDPKHLKIEFNKGELISYLRRVIKVNSKVKAFYEAQKNRIFIE
jgi:ATP-dependent exoDNAse (exonuclease V) alpha subunit